MAESVADLASGYFRFLAARFPVMCASDEFQFLPRAGDASEYYDRLDDLSIDRVEDCIQALKGFQSRLNALSASEEDLERVLDIALLKGNLAGVLIELEDTRSWRHNPLLYLKTAFIGLDHALSKPASGQEEVVERTAARINAIPRLLQQAIDNLQAIPEMHHRAALFMLADCQEYLAELAQSLSHIHSETNSHRPRLYTQHSAPSTRHYLLRIGLEKAHDALTGFEKFLRASKPIPDRDFERRGIEATLREHFVSLRSLSEVFEIAVDEWQENLRALQKLQSQIDPSKTWRELYHSYSPTGMEKLDTIVLYRLEADRLQKFFHGHGFKEADSAPFPEVRETPVYLQSVRSSASFAAAFSADPREKDFFYITTILPEPRSNEAVDLLRKRLHREYKFLSAHETFPGHHLLDFTRRNLKNRIRAQIESPLFYEGWAYYVESLLTEYGYVDHPLDWLVDRKRRLWRAARCQIDVGLGNGLLSETGAMDLLTAAGFSREEAGNQIDRFRLNPGYQLCYSLGRYEIIRLREKYGNRLGRDRFHREILQGGELPFHLIEKRLASLSAANEKSEEG